MQFKISLLMALALGAFAAPSPDPIITARAVTTASPATGTIAASCVVKTFNPKATAPPTFTNATCTLSKALTPGQPLSCFFPTADKIGQILGPTLKKALGPTTIDDIDKVAENLCVSAQQDPKDGSGLCDNALQAVNDLAVAKDKKAADKYRCLLNLLCVAHTSPKNTGTCQFLLAGVDCIANRIVGATDKECDGTGA